MCPENKQTKTPQMPDQPQLTIYRYMQSCNILLELLTLSLQPTEESFATYIEAPVLHHLPNATDEQNSRYLNLSAWGKVSLPLTPNWKKHSMFFFLKDRDSY